MGAPSAKKELFYAISVRESTRPLQWEREVCDYERGAQKLVNAVLSALVMAFR